MKNQLSEQQAGGGCSILFDGLNGKSVHEGAMSIRRSPYCMNQGMLQLKKFHSRQHGEVLIMYLEIQHICNAITDDDNMSYAHTNIQSRYDTVFDSMDIQNTRILCRYVTQPRICTRKRMERAEDAQ